MNFLLEQHGDTNLGGCLIIFLIGFYVLSVVALGGIALLAITLVAVTVVCLVLAIIDHRNRRNVDAQG